MASRFSRLGFRTTKYSLIGLGVWNCLEFAGVIDSQATFHTVKYRFHTKNIGQPEISPPDKLASNNFPYQKFRTSGTAGDIRVVDLQPGSGDQKVELRIRNVALRYLLKYHALSYEWGEEKNLREIDLNGFKFLVTPNLYSALENLRDSKEPLTLWIDAICINQNDKEEKSQQLMKMADIYELARSVIIWLGPSDISASKDSIKNILSGLTILKNARALANSSVTPFTTHLDSAEKDPKALPTTKIGTTTASFYNLDLPSSTGPPSKLEQIFAESLVKTPSDWLFLKKVIENTYFERSWIIQEVILGKNRKMRLGNCELSADKVFDAVYFIATNPWFQEYLEPKISISDAALNRVLKLAQITNAHASGLRLPLGSLLWDFREKKATEARDHIYSLVGIASYKFKDTGIMRPRLVYPTRMPISSQLWPTPIMMDSSKPTYQVFRQAASFIMKDEESLALLGQVDAEAISQKGNPDLRQEWASWVPNWAHNQLRKPLATVSSDISEVFPKRWQTIDIEGNSLFVKGHHIDTIVASTPLASEKPPGELILQLLQRNAKVKHITGHPTNEALLRTLVRDSSAVAGKFQAFHNILLKLDGKLPTIDTPDYRSAIVRTGKSLQKRGISIKDFSYTIRALDHFSSTLHETSRSLSVTKQGYFILGPAAAKPGDEVFIVGKSPAPLVLRKMGEHYRLVGDCYAHGLVNKEDFKNVNWDPITVEIR